MGHLRFLTAGESHGPGLVGIVEGLPAGVPILEDEINHELFRRQQGYGRGGRMKIEKDTVEILSGVRFARTLGSPVALLVRNRDFANWGERMKIGAGGPDPKPVSIPRPGHADLAGGLKYDCLEDMRDVLERASARETTMRVALGAVAKAFLRELGIEIGSYVRSIGIAEGVGAETAFFELSQTHAEGLSSLADRSETRALDEASSIRFVEAIKAAQKRRDTLGGVFEVMVTGLPVGLGAHVHADRKLDGRLSGALMSIQAMKAVEIGDGWAGSKRYGSEVHDPLYIAAGKVHRGTNHAGGLEGGITNGDPLVIRLAMKPIATVSAALPSFDVRTLEAVPAHVERSDTCAVPAAGVIAEALTALTLCDALLEVMGGDTLKDIRLPFAKHRLLNRSQLGHLFLIGPMGAGKSTVGQRLAQLTGMPFIDLDHRIEAESGQSIAALFQSQGEEAFRKSEAAMLQRISKETLSVISLGGGAVLNDEAWRTMRSSGVVLRLSAAAHELARRLQNGRRPIESRPLLAGKEDLTAFIEQTNQARERFYSRADITLRTDGLDVSSTAQAAWGMFRQLEGPLARR